MANTDKVVIVGAGRVGATAAFCMLDRGLAAEIILIDIDERRALGEALDLSHAVPFCEPARVRSGSYPDCEGAALVVITAGASQRPGETRLELYRRNLSIFEQMLPEIGKYAGDAVVVIVTNPVDLLTRDAIRILGGREGRVFGSGTLLDTARLRQLIGRHTEVDPRDVYAFVLGEHGDSEVAALAEARVGGLSLEEFCRQCGRCEGNLTCYALEAFESQVAKAAYEVIALKGATYFAPALAVERIARAVLRDEQAVLTVSVPINGLYGIEDVCLSLPAKVGRHGASKPLFMELDPDEVMRLRESAARLSEAMEVH